MTIPPRKESEHHPMVGVAWGKKGDSFCGGKNGESFKGKVYRWAREGSRFSMVPTYTRILGGSAGFLVFSLGSLLYY
jgi:hypothetical protein